MTQAKGAVLVLPKACKKAYLEKAKAPKGKGDHKGLQEKDSQLEKGKQAKGKGAKGLEQSLKGKKGPPSKGNKA